MCFTTDSNRLVTRHRETKAKYLATRKTLSKMWAMVELEASFITGRVWVGHSPPKVSNAVFLYDRTLKKTEEAS